MPERTGPGLQSSCSPAGAHTAGGPQYGTAAPWDEGTASRRPASAPAGYLYVPKHSRQVVRLRSQVQMIQDVLIHRLQVRVFDVDEPSAAGRRGEGGGAARGSGRAGGPGGGDAEHGRGRGEAAMRGSPLLPSPAATRGASRVASLDAGNPFRVFWLRIWQKGFLSICRPSSSADGVRPGAPSR